MPSAYVRIYIYLLGSDQKGSKKDQMYVHNKLRSYSIVVIMACM